MPTNPRFETEQPQSEGSFRDPFVNYSVSASGGAHGLDP